MLSCFYFGWSRGGSVSDLTFLLIKADLGTFTFFSSFNWPVSESSSCVERERERDSERGREREGERQREKVEKVDLCKLCWQYTMTVWSVCLLCHITRAVWVQRHKCSGFQIYSFRWISSAIYRKLIWFRAIWLVCVDAEDQFQTALSKYLHSSMSREEQSRGKTGNCSWTQAVLNDQYPMLHIAMCVCHQAVVGCPRSLHNHHSSLDCFHTALHSQSMPITPPGFGEEALAPSHSVHCFHCCHCVNDHF